MPLDLKDNKQVYFIAEIGSNFDGSLKRALKLIDIAKDSGADAVKFQHYTASSLVSDIGFTRINNILKNRGFMVEEINFSKISKLGGLFRCSTLPLKRK